MLDRRSDTHFAQHRQFIPTNFDVNALTASFPRTAETNVPLHNEIIGSAQPTSESKVMSSSEKHLQDPEEVF